MLLRSKSDSWQERQSRSRVVYNGRGTAKGGKNGAAYAHRNPQVLTKGQTRMRKHSILLAPLPRTS